MTKGVQLLSGETDIQTEVAWFYQDLILFNCAINPGIYASFENENT